ncbi:MAG: methionine ABC transporter permease [Oscillospiraceae bacterium]|nr:ABC transporter permease [Oscillospiraceae bacterium]MDY4191301.1 methionine ABC transporter permease [Oscillospiraceae bacterium]
MDIFWENTLMILEGLGASLYMTLFATLFAYVLGLPLGVLTIITGRDSILPAPRLHSVLGWVINIGRSIPFIILMVALIPFTRFVVGRATGSTAAIVPLVVAAAPFVARMVETSLEEVDPGVVEAARTMGATTWQIIYKVFLPESVPSLIRGASITTITLIGYSAIAGAIGAGGLGDIAIRFGYYRYQDDIMIYTIVVLVVLVQIIQSVFNFTAKKIDKRSV